MPVLGVCGDSFMSATLNGNTTALKNSEGKHFTEILANKIDYEYFTLARGGCSNTAIRLQIDEMVLKKVDLVLIGITTPGRMEFPHRGQKYNRGDGIYNLDYRKKYYPDRSTKNKRFKHRFITDTFTNIFTDDIPLNKKLVNLQCAKFHPVIDNDQLNALEYYIDHLFDVNYKSQMDTWALHSGAKMLEDNKIPFVFANANFYEHVEGWKNNSSFPDIKSPLNPWLWEPGNRRWHTTDRAQVIGACYWHNYLIEHNFIKV